MLTELGVLDGVTEHVTDGVCDGVCDGVWLFGKDSFEECPLTLRRSSVLWGNHSTLFPHSGSKKGVVEGFAKHNPLCLGVWKILPPQTKHKHLSESLFISTMMVLWLPQSTNFSLSQVYLSGSLVAPGIQIFSSQNTCRGVTSRLL